MVRKRGSKTKLNKLNKRSWPSRRNQRSRRSRLVKGQAKIRRRKTEGGGLPESLKDETCRALFRNKKDSKDWSKVDSRTHYSACKWLHPLSYKDVKKHGPFKWISRRFSRKKPKPTPPPVAISAQPSPQELEQAYILNTPGIPSEKVKDRIAPTEIVIRRLDDTKEDNEDDEDKDEFFDAPDGLEGGSSRRRGPARRNRKPMR